MRKIFLLLIAFYSLNLADTTDTSAQNIPAQIISNVSDSLVSSARVEITNMPSFGETLGNTFISLLAATLIGGVILWFIQKKTLEKQYTRESFENHFFNLLEHQYNILRNIRIKFNTTIYDMELFGRGLSKETFNNINEGMEFFSLMKKYLNYLYKYQMTFSNTDKQSFVAHLTNENLLEIDELRTFYNESPARKFDNKSEYENNLKFLEEISLYTYNFIYYKYYDYLGHYFRHLFNILKYIESKEDQIKKFGGDSTIYTGLIQARMSFSELYVLFYNGLYFDKMKPKIDKYGLIENLPIEDLMDERHKLFYECKMKSKKSHKSSKNISEKNGKDMDSAS